MGALVPQTTLPMALQMQMRMQMPHSTPIRPQFTRRAARHLATVASAFLLGMFAGCASEPETAAPQGQPAQATGQAAAKSEDDSWWPSLPSLGVPKVHKIVIQQGNVITQQMVDRLKPGMTKAQALYVMGRPVLEDLFDPDRWVYIYSVQIPDEPEIKQTLTLYFENDALTRFTGDFTPTPTKPEATAPASGTAAAPGAPAAAANAATTAPVATSVPGAPATPVDTSIPSATPASASPAPTAPAPTPPAPTPPATATPEPASPGPAPAAGNTTAGAPLPLPPAR